MQNILLPYSANTTSTILTWHQFYHHPRKHFGFFKTWLLQFIVLWSSCCISWPASKSAKFPGPCRRYPSVWRHHHITPTLKELHWLPIHQCIHFKISSLTFKTLQNLQPSYLSDLLTPHTPSRNLWSLDKHLLTVLDIRSANDRHSFTFAAPIIWNSLPIALRSCPSLPTFLSDLKTHFFPP